MRTWLLPLVLLLLARSAAACGLCNRMLDVRATIREAAVVAVVTSEGTPRGAEWTTLAVERVLKGKLKDRTLRARAWSGMCDYGFALAPGTYLAFFQYGAAGLEPVHQGCAVKALPVKDGMVEGADRPVTPEALVRKALARPVRREGREQK